MNTIYFTTWDTRPEEFPRYLVTWRSILANVNLTGIKVFIIDCGAAPELLAQIPPQFERISMPLVHMSSVAGVDCRWAQWKATAGDDSDQILFIDCRDVLFQRNPFDDVKPYELIGCGEGTLHRQDGWNTDQNQCLKECWLGSVADWPDIADWPIVNAGIFGGLRSRVRNLLIEEISIGMLMAETRGTDQAAWNYLWNTKCKFDPKAWVCDPNASDWCLSGGQMHGLTSPPKVENEMLVCAATGQPYALFHQWDRTHWRNSILQTWAK